MENRPPELSGLGPDLLRFNRLIDFRELVDGVQHLTLPCVHVIQPPTPVPAGLRYIPCNACLAAWLAASPASENQQQLAQEREIHRKRHLDLHNAFDELLGDYMLHHNLTRPSQITLLQLLQWSHAQTLSPDAPDGLQTDTAREIHGKRHLHLHSYYDELVADYLAHNQGALPSQATLMELLKWAHAQTLSPDGHGHLTRGRYLFARHRPLHAVVSQ